MIGCIEIKIFTACLIYAKTMQRQLVKNNMG